MPINTIALRKAYTTNLDAVYKLASVTAVLDGPSDLVKEGANAHELLIPKMDMNGLADYDKDNGYALGSVTYEYETKTISYDRGRKFQIDSVDNMDTLNQAFGRLAGEFVRTKVVPELDSYRLAQYAQDAGLEINQTYNSGEAVIADLSRAKVNVKEHEGDIATCVLYISPACKQLIEIMDTTSSRAALEGWGAVVEVPSSRFYTEITLNNNGFVGSGNSINFLVIPKEAVIQFSKQDVGKIITPDMNQNADAWLFGYRTVGIAETYDNKKGAIAVSFFV